MLFHYRYLDQKGKKRKGSVSALHLEEAKETLRAHKTLVLSLYEAKAKAKKTERLTSSTLLAFTSQLASLLQAGIPLYESLLSLEEQYREEGFHPILLHLCDAIKRGDTLSNAMSRFPDSFNHLYSSMITAGESVGSLAVTLEKLAVLLRKQNKLKKDLVTAALYPALLLSFSVGLLSLLLTFVIPSLELLFEDRPVNRLTGWVIGCSHFLRHDWYLYLPLTLGAGLGLYYFLKSPQGKQWVQRQLLTLPLVKTVVTYGVCARFSRTLGTLLEGGVSLLPALEISRQVMRHPSFETVLAQAEQRIIEGSLLSIELKKSALIPSLLTRMVAVGEEGGSLASMLHKSADLYEEELEKLLSRLTTLAQPVILLSMGAIVGLIMLAVLLPLTDVNSFL